jgi:hypothetical protein
VLQASTAGLTLGNLISLGAGGLTLQGSNDTTLAGVISGGGGLVKSGAGQLTLRAPTPTPAVPRSMAARCRWATTSLQHFH